MADVIVNQSFLGIFNGAFHRLQLLGKLVAWSALLIISMIMRRWPSARLSRLMIAG